MKRGRSVNDNFTSSQPPLKKHKTSYDYYVNNFFVLNVMHDWVPVDNNNDDDDETNSTTSTTSTTSTWSCTICTVKNTLNDAKCNVCGTEKEEEKKNNNNNDNDDNEIENNDYCIVVIGTSGVGKSSTIKLFCGDDVPTASGSKSHTKHTTIYPEIGNDRKLNRKWMDTQGTDDNEMKDDDEVILKKAFKPLYDKNICNMKLIWIVSGEMERERGEYQKQAKFISNFGNDIWNSCLIVHKEGLLQPSLNKIQGAIAAAKSYGSNINYENKENEKKYLFGFSCLDWIKNDKKEKENDRLNLINMLQEKERPKQLFLNGFLDGNMVKEFLEDKLNALPTSKVDFLNEKCTKCGEEGDRRFITAKCHTESIKHHPKKLENYHPEKLINYHPQQYDGNILKRIAKAGGKGVGTAAATNNPLIGLSTAAVDLVERIDSIGYQCCGADKNNEGCAVKYPCCNMPNGAVGCRQRYLCCDNESNQEDEGCEEICKFCSKQWGNSPGCQDVEFM